MTTRGTALAITLALGLLAGCAGGPNCEPPLTEVQCRSAFEQADTALGDHPVWIAGATQPTRMGLAGKACRGSGCAEDPFDGFARVHVWDASQQLVGSVLVCIDEGRCGGEAPTFDPSGP